MERLESQGQQPAGMQPVASRKQDLWQTVLQEIDQVAARLELDPGIHRLLRQPERESASHYILVTPSDERVTRAVSRDPLRPNGPG